jgi:1-hydroxycarotenoid 3,4-desaturase
MTNGRIVVIGAGVGGLAAAMLLAARGHAVTVLERGEAVGGKMRTMVVAGRHIDAGPTVLTLRPVFEQLFKDCGLDFGVAVRMARADVLTRHAWSANERLDLYADRQRSADAIGDFAGAAAARGYLEFCAHAKSVYQTMDPLFMRADRPTPVGMVRAAGLSGIRGLLSSAPFTTLWDSLAAYFPDPRLRQLYGRYATYCGSSPFLAPATLALIAHVEQEGVWIVEGGMRSFADALGKAATMAGATIRTGVEVREILVERGRAAGVHLASGETITARAVVTNCDAGALATGELGAGAQSAVAADAMLPRSLSAATWGMVAHVTGFSLAHHSVFFSRSSQREFADLFERQRVPDEPTVYVCAADRTAAGGAPEEREQLFVIVNAPADAGRSLRNPEDIERCRRAMLRTLERCGLRLTIEAEAHTGPAEFARRFPGTDGAIYGMASHGWTASFRRPGVRSQIPGLYMTGGSVHPGAGLPMAALSGRAAAQSLMADIAST